MKLLRRKNKPRKQNRKKKEIYSVYPRKLKTQITIIFAVVLFWYFYSIEAVQADFPKLFFDIDDIFAKLLSMFPPDWSYIEAAIDPLIETIQVAIVATTFSVLISIPMSLLSANTIVKSKFVYQLFRNIMNLLRTLPDILLATIFVSLFSVGLMPGILALTVFSLGLLAKLLSETIETIDPRQLEAIRSTGGNIIQVIWYGVVPQVLPSFISYGLYVFELNVRASLVLGFVGAGGIGSIIDTQLNFMQYQKVMAVLVVLLVAVVIIETISNMLRRRVV